MIRMPIRLAPLCAAFAAGLATGCAQTPAHRYFQPTADQVGPAPNNFGEVVIPRHGLIVVQGDDEAYGLDAGRSRQRINGADRGQASTTISQTLRGVVGGAVEVENRGYPGDTVAAGAARWAGRPAGNLLILSYGLGDMAAHTPLNAFTDGLRAMVRAAHASGAAVFVVLSPPLADPLANNEAAPYRGIAAAVAQQERALLFDPAAAMARIKSTPSKTPAQRPSDYQAIAADMAPYIKILDAPG